MGCCCSSRDRVRPSDEADTQLHNVSRDNSVSEYQGPVKKRGCTDVFFLLLFAAFVIGLGYLVVYCVLHGDIFRIVNGYDDLGYVCGRKNGPPPDPKCSQVDVTNKKLLSLRISPDYKWRECVAECSSEQRQILNRCVPVSKVNEKSLSALFSKSGIADFLQDVAEDLEQCKLEILYLFLIALGFSIVILILFRFLVGIVVWIVLIAAMIASVLGTVLLWILWKRKKDEAKNNPETNVTSYLAYAIVATIVTVIIWLVIIAMRKRIHLVIQLFKEAGKSISSMPCLLAQPFLTFLILGGTVAAWLYFVLWIESAGFLTSTDPQKTCQEPNSYFYYKKDITIKVSRWYNLFAFFWFLQFVIGCQHMVIAGAVSAWFFTRNKNSLGCPILQAFWNVVRYHMGSIALGSFIIALVQMARAVLKFIETHVKGKENAVSRCIFYTCQCCLYCFEKVLQYLSRNAYIEIAMYGHSFCKAGQQAFKLLANNALRVVAINSVGDFVLFLGKAVVVTATVVSGVYLLEKKENIQNKWIPLVLAGLFAYIVSHCFLTVYEMAIDTIFLCFCEDCERNDGLSRPYFMSRGLMEFVKNSKKSLSNRDSPAKKSEAWSSSSRQLNQ